MNLPNPITRYWTVDEYLAMERQSPERHVFVDGMVYAMAGESTSHSYIAMNVGGQLYIQLRGKSCVAFTKDTKVRSGPGPKDPKSRRPHAGMFSYPDVVVVCGELRYHDHFEDVIVNPTVVIEILSDSTEKFDRGEKFLRYHKHNETLQEYVLIAQDQPRIELLRRGDGDWSIDIIEGLEAEVEIASIGCVLKLADVYERVEFPESDFDVEESK